MTVAPIANVVIFWSIAPFFTFIFSWAFLGERAHKNYILIFALAITGLVLAKPLQGGHMLGNLVALADGAVYAAMVTYMRYEGKTETGNDIAWSMLAGAIFLSPFPFIFGAGDVMGTIHYEALGMELPVMLWAFCLGVVSTGFAYFGISIVLKKLNANTYALVDIIVSPVVASTLGYLIFGETPATGMIYGGALLLGSGFWLTREMSRDPHKKAVHPCQCGLLGC
ncbi:MAG: EamA family transporter [Fodinibius sp.]|nr:EamA family transporter [Fodinibius sp.]